MAKKQRGKSGRSKAAGQVSAIATKRADRQTRKQLRSQRGKQYTASEFSQFNAALADSGLVLKEMQGDASAPATLTATSDFRGFLSF